MTKQARKLKWRLRFWCLFLIAATLLGSWAIHWRAAVATLAGWLCLIAWQGIEHTTASSRTDAQTKQG